MNENREYYDYQICMGLATFLNALHKTSVMFCIDHCIASI